MTLDDAALLTGERTEDLRHWQELGMLGESDELTAGDIERARLIGFAVRRGVSAGDVARICAEHGDMLASFVGLLEAPGRTRIFTFDEVAERAAVDPGLLDRVWTASGLRDQSYAYDEDVEALGWTKTAFQIGIPEDVVLQIVRVFADNLSRVADAANRLFHLYVHERFRAEGLSGPELFAATQAISDQVVGLVDPAVQYFFRKGWERAVREDFLLHLAEEMTPPADVPGQVVRAVLFVDLSSFTPLTEAMGDTAAARVVDRFSEIVRDAAAGCQGQVVKQIGDEFMLVFADGRSAVACGLAVQDKAHAEPRFPALRIGAHVGPVLYREGDYLGTAVNTAARVAASATRHQFLVTDAVRRQLDDAVVEVVAVGPRALKGLSEEVELFELRRPGPRRAREVDPVCGMELDEPSAEAQLVWQGTRLLFCSETCLRRFLQAPDRYEVGATGA